MSRLIAFALLLSASAGCSGINAPERWAQGEKAMEVKDYDLAISCYTDYIKARPEDARGYIKRGEVYAETNQPSQAIADFTEAIKIDPNDPSAYRGRATAFFKLRRFDDHKRDWDKADAISKK